MTRDSIHSMSTHLPKLLFGLLFLASTAWSYQGEIHQKMTFAAARQFNLCAPGAELPPLTPLQVRYIARSAVKESDSRMMRAFRWGFYEREGHNTKRLLGLVQTRLHERFEKLEVASSEADNLLEYYSVVGQIMAHIQDMSVPVYVVPIYFSRFWRLSMRDRLSVYPIDVELLTAKLGERNCEQLLGEQATPAQLLSELAEMTIVAIRQPILGQEPATWESFWEFDDAGKFGKYGPAGNRFGERTDFSCGDQTCLFLEDDPLYREFALERHLDALQFSLRLMRWAQQNQE